MKSGHRRDLLTPWQTCILLLLFRHPLGLIGPKVEIMPLRLSPMGSTTEMSWLVLATYPFLSSHVSPSSSYRLGGLAILRAL